MLPCKIVSHLNVPPGPRDDAPESRCAQCGERADVYYRGEDGEIVGCEHCLQTIFWYETDDNREEEP